MCWQRRLRGQGDILDRNLTILIAEDSQDDAFFLERALRKIGLKNPVQILVDGHEAETIAGHVDIRRPLVKNLSLLPKPEPPASLEP